MLTSLSVDEILSPRYVDCSFNFRVLPFKVKMAPSCLNIWTLFYLRLLSGQFLLPLVIEYAAGIQLGQGF